MTTVLTIFGVTMFGEKLVAVAKDIPTDLPKTNPETALSPSGNTKQSQEFLKALSGAAASVCGLAVTSGSFVLGAACGLVVAIGILKAQGK